MKRGLFVGRFQPYHLGHHEALKNALQKVDEMIIVVGSAKEAFQVENPFTAGERVEMIGLALKAENLFDKCYIICVDDIAEYALWTQRIRSYCPRFEIVFTNNPLVKELFEVDGVKVEKLVSRKPKIDSTEVRKRIFLGKDVSAYVPSAVKDFLVSINAKKRLESILTKEVKQ
ncbi:MAG: nicotinamide-nucleotide adenylyltransferase [Candidatus Diapherotrites archaeon]